MIKHYRQMRIISIVIALSLLFGALAGCIDDIPQPSLGTEDFDSFINELFVDEVTADSISLNYYVANPSTFGIEPIVPTLGEVATLESIRREAQKDRELAARLRGFDYNALSTDNQIIYDILSRSYEIYEVISDRDDFAFYMGYIRPLNGIQIQLPILLAEFNFRAEEDFEIYFALLEDTRRYFDDIVVFERERSRRGTFLSAENVDKVLEHIESFTADREDNLMILVFNDIVDEYDGLSGQQREDFKRRNRELVLSHFLPAYDNLAAAMRELRGVGANTGGLANLPDGRAYAQAYLQYRTDSNMTIDQMDTALTRKMTSIQRELMSIIESEPYLWDMFINDEFGELAPASPENYMAMLNKAIAGDFPPLGPTSYVVREVHESLQEHVSPAFYLVPAVDSFYDNVIYINPSGADDNLTLYTTLAHEGYPGHMYQAVYFLQQSPHPIRNLLSGIGYTEGWATYVEMQSYFYAGLDEKEAALLQLSRAYDMLFISRIDLGVNGMGWDINRLARFLREMGIEDMEVVEDIFHTVTGVPLLYLPYSIGYLEMLALRDEASGALGNSFKPMEFHRFVLDFGPAPFTLLNKHMTDWVAYERSTVLVSPTN